MSTRVKIVSKPGKKSIQKSSFGIIRKLSADNLYKQINDDLFKTFNTEPQSYKFDSLDKVPILKPLIDLMKDDIKAPGDVSPVVWIGIAGRESGTFIQAPPKICALRILVNLGYAETYNFLPRYKVKESKEIVDPITNKTNIIYTEKNVDSGLEEHQTYLEANSYAVLGPINHCDYLIKVNSDPKITIPSKMPNEAPKVTRRPRDYKRITIVFDYLATIDIINNLNNLINSANIPKIKVNAGASPKMIENEMKKLQNNISKDTIFKKQVDDVLNKKVDDPKINGEKVDDATDFDKFEKEVVSSLEAEKVSSGNNIIEIEKSQMDKDILAEINNI